ncbi:MAG: hypothetical protein ACI4AA_10490 [Lachnospiraceae bacterium]
MTDNSFGDVKIHNEIEFCVVHDLDVKKQIERAFLSNGISYYEKWDEPSFWGRIFGEGGRTRCTLCINSMQADKASGLLDELHLDPAEVEMIMKRVDRTYF